ncbi:uncharacterized protein LOC132631096 [Lycium barbarum]|uniref:uncharacterized protein LOC132631096 n=1 Tax=Lycium barbarum TaxID=112863 RepID=UPI00293F21BD|nr:uncharacterized protein LOC132631096 [Lycium barbarum]
MEDISESHIIKKWWRLRTQPSLWANFLQNKYCKRAHCVTKVVGSADSHTWKSLMKIKTKVEPHIIWKIQSGNSSFWWDNWTGNRALAKIFPGIERSAKLPINSFFTNNCWNMTKLLTFFPLQVAQDIAQVDISDLEEPNFPVWQPTEDGSFSNKSAWHLIRTRGPKNSFYKNLWHNRIPFKVSFLNWRIFKKKVPFDDTISRFGTNRRSMCICCRISTYETIQHFFAESEAGQQLWNFFGNPLGIQHTIQPIVGNFKRWWNTNNTNNVHKLILQITPTIICWELWKQRCSCKYGKQRQIQMGKMQYQGVWTVKAALSKLYAPIKDINH